MKSKQVIENLTSKPNYYTISTNTREAWNNRVKLELNWTELQETVRKGELGLGSGSSRLDER